MIDSDDIQDALYAAADATRKTPPYSEVKNSTPTEAQMAKFKTQVIRFLSVLPEDTTVHEILELLQ